MKGKNILIIGNCGVGKTWVMKQLIERLELTKRYKLGKISYATNGKINVLGKYDNTMYEGSDRLSMSVITDVEEYLNFNKGKTTIAEGDRFMNNRYIGLSDSTVIKIDGTGEEGRAKRNSSQTARHLKAINTRVSNIQADHIVKDSKECVELIINLL